MTGSLLYATGTALQVLAFVAGVDQRVVGFSIAAYGLALALLWLR